MPTKSEYVKFKTFERKIKSPFMIMESKIQVSLILINMKKRVLVVMFIN